ncbi:MAG TPA: NAD(P)H-dependent oxidoreductase [Rhodanobacteraceae bacterium]|nr:NAD(P)H-dependent oxidoreductase [Rhodanobacteraceae bacterium]
MKLLHLDASALGAHSVSRQLSAAVVAAYRRAHPGTKVDYRDLAAQPIPHWAPVADASREPDGVGQAVLDQFLDADVIVIGAPMYNFGIPSQLKAWIDRIAVPGKAFRYTADGPEGLAGGKQVIVASARGGVYSTGPAAAMDFQEPYLRTVLGFFGITDVSFVRAEGVGMGEDARAAAIERALESIDGVAAEAA